MHIVIFWSIILGFLAFLSSLIRILQNIAGARKARNLLVDLLQTERVKALRIIGDRRNPPHDRNEAERMYKALAGVQGRLQSLTPEFSLSMWRLVEYTPPMKPFSEQWREIKVNISPLFTDARRRFFVFVIRKILQKKSRSKTEADFRSNLLEEINEDLRRAR